MRIFGPVHKTSAGYKFLDPRNDDRASSFEHVLQSRNEDVSNEVDHKLSRIIVCGTTSVSDAATMHQRPVSNFMLKAFVHKLPLMLDLVDSTKML